MIFVLLAIVILIISFVVALISLIREQKRANLANRQAEPAENVENIHKPEAIEPIGKLEDWDKLPVPSELPQVDNGQFPWGDTNKSARDMESYQSIIEEIERLKGNKAEKGEQKLSGEISVKEIVDKR